MAVRTAAKKAAPRSGAKVIDFGNVKERGAFNTKHVEDGDYSAKVTKVDFTEAKDGEEMWVFHVVLDEHPRATYPYYCKLVENQLWKLKNIFEAAGIKVGQRKVKVDPSKLIGKAIGVAMEDDEFEGRLKSVIAEVFPADEVGGAIEGEEEDGSDLVEDDEDDVEEEAPKKRTKKAAPVEEEEDEDEDEDEEEEEEEPAPKKRPAKKAAAKKAPARKRRPADDEDEEDDEDMEIDEL